MLTLEPEAKPEERRSLAVYMSGLLDEPGGNAGCGLPPGGGAVCQHGFEFVPAHRMRRHEVIVDQVVAPEDVQEGKGQGGIAAGKGLQVQIGSLRRRGTHGIEDDDPPWCFVQAAVVGSGVPADRALAVIGDRALGAQLATADRMLRITADVGHHTMAFDHSDPTRVKTVAWTGRTDDFPGLRHRVPFS